MSKKMTIQQLKDKINKKYGEGTITTASKAQALQLERIPTGSLSLDIETGGGYPRGRITIIAGDYSVGKSFMGFKAVAEAQKKYPEETAWWIDNEGAFIPEWAEKFGIDLDRLEVVRPATSEQALDIVIALLQRDDVSIIVFDSIASSSPTAELEASMEETTVALQARLFNKFFRKAQAVLNIGNLEEKQKKPALLMINQLRSTMDKYSPETKPGGRGQDFHSSIEIYLKRGDRFIETRDDGTDVYVGHTVKFKTEKNKTFPPKRAGQFDIYVDDSETGFKAGDIDRLKEIISFAVRWDIIQKRGAWFTILDNPEWKFQGGPKVLEFLRENEEARLEVERQVMAVALNESKRGQKELVTEDGRRVDPETGEILDE